MPPTTLCSVRRAARSATGRRPSRERRSPATTTYGLITGVTNQPRDMQLSGTSELVTLIDRATNTEPPLAEMQAAVLVFAARASATPSSAQRVTDRETANGGRLVSVFFAARGAECFGFFAECGAGLDFAARARTRDEEALPDGALGAEAPGLDCGCEPGWSRRERIRACQSCSVWSA